MFYKTTVEHIIIQVRIKANSSRSAFNVIENERLKINIKAPAIEGKANRALIAFLAKAFKIPQQRIEIIQGQTSKFKTLKLPYSKAIHNFILTL